MFEGQIISEFITEHKNGKLILHTPQIEPKELLIVQTLKERWKIFYRSIRSDEQLREELREYEAKKSTNL